jgi:glycine hydroxymethyltransferase
VIRHSDDEKTIAGVKEEVKTFMQQFPLYPELG